MIGGFVACAGSQAVDLQGVAARLEQLRLKPTQQSFVIAFGPLTVGILSHPLDTDCTPFQPLIRLDGRHFALLWGTVPDAQVKALPVATGRLTATVAQWTGSFILAVIDQHNGSLQLFRDALGDRAAFQRKINSRWWLATDEKALLEPGHRLRGSALACQFALRYPPADQSPYHEVGCLPAGHSIVLDRSGISAPQRYWQFAYLPELRRASQAELEVRFCQLLEQAVADQTRAGDCAVAVSGGMDSTAIASALSPATPTRLYTYHLPQTPDCDESQYAMELGRHLGQALELVDCTATEPLSEQFFNTPAVFGDPSCDAYHAMRYALLQRASHNGHKVVLTGDFADQLYCGYYYCLRDLLGSSDWWRGVKLVASRISSARFGLLRDPLLRRVLPLNGITRGWRRHLPDWLTPQAVTALDPATDELDYRIRQSDRISAAINSFTARGAHLGYLQGLAWGVELRAPFRDRRLVEFMLSLAAYHWYDPVTDQTKAIARRAMAGRLPESIIRRVGKTSLEPIFRTAILHHHRATAQALLRQYDQWQAYVEPAWLWRQLEQPQPDSAALYTLWNCLGLALWQKSQATIVYN